MDPVRFTLSNEFLNVILANNFGIPSAKYQDTKIYLGLGIDFDETQFVFTKEPVSKGFTILPQSIEFNEPVNGIIRNKNAVSWPKAEPRLPYRKHCQYQKHLTSTISLLRNDLQQAQGS